QNAGASEEMSATSEELAAQAEELQASIAFFKVERQSAAAAMAGRSSAKAPASQAAGRKAASPQRPAKAGQSVATQQDRAKGFALNLTMGGPDDEDKSFKESA
ncbi:methyl-accepting chemotaxis protein, partial [Allorhizobium sp. BGMRC 0089]|nr:methyl-accepting chemotaxis protein [Allorhizobium sonneratiae]